MTSYWKPEPRRYSFSWFALLVPAITYAAGVIVFSHNAFVPDAAGENGHAVGSALMVLGGEAGTLAAAAEVFRKHQHGEANGLNWAGLGVSLVATLGNLFVVYVALTSISAAWVAWVRLYGPLVLLLCSAIDFYAGIMEFGFYNASYDKRWESWNDGRHAHQMRERRRAVEDDAPLTPSDAPMTPDDAPVTPDDAAVTPDDASMTPPGEPVTPDDAPVTRSDAPLTPDSEPVNTGDDSLTPRDAPLTPIGKADFVNMVSSGVIDAIGDASDLSRWLREGGYEVPSASTLRRWYSTYKEMTQ